MPAYPGESANEISAALGALPLGSPASEVVGRLLDLFTSGSIAPGTRLPPERQLAATLEVGRSAVREALAALEILGIVDVRPGSGTYLRGTASALLPQTLRWGLLIGERHTQEMLEMRAGLEIYVARLAAGRARPDQLEEMERRLERMRSSLNNLKVFAAADLEFHHVLGEASGNSTLVDQLSVVRSLLHVYAGRAVHDQGAARLALEEHEAIYRALVVGDEDLAASAMAIHMASASRRLATETA